jgi:hypothetical protein
MSAVTVLTVATNNYLPLAKCLGDSVLRHNPEYRFVIGLVDKPHPRMAELDLSRFEIVPLEDVGIPDLDRLVKNYTIVEFATALKPFYLEYLLNNGARETVVYLDADCLVFSSLQDTVNRLEGCNIILTPHVCQAEQRRPTQLRPLGNFYLQTGIYNLGFIGVRNSPETRRFLSWWQDRLWMHCLRRPEIGLFYDQLWINAAPIFFEGVLIDKNPGLNVAYWNLGERNITASPNGYVVNGAAPLVFFHFSGFKRHKVRGDSEEMKQLCELYSGLLEENKHTLFADIEWYYEGERRAYRRAAYLAQGCVKRAAIQTVLFVKRMIPRRLVDFVEACRAYE